MKENIYTKKNESEPLDQIAAADLRSGDESVGYQDAKKGRKIGHVHISQAITKQRRTTQRLFKQRMNVNITVETVCDYSIY